MADKKIKSSPGTPATDWQAKADEYLTGWQRTRADFDNYRKRTEAAHRELVDMATAAALLPITAIVDDFRRAFQSIPADVADSAWVAGIRQVDQRLRHALADHGLRPIEDGGSFDPRRHEAIAAEPHPKLLDGQIIDTVELGWQLGDRVVKPAKVRVSQGQKSATAGAGSRSGGKVRS